MTELIDRLQKRYGNPPIPDCQPGLHHHGDCWIYGAKICTCGLLADLAFHGEEVQALYPAFDAEYYEHHDRLYDINLRDHGLMP